MEIPKEDLLNALRQAIDITKGRMAEMNGVRYHENQNGFTQEDIYRLCGRDDATTIISLRPGSDGFLAYGGDVTVNFVYTHKERKSLEQNPASLDDTPRVKAKALLLDNTDHKAVQLLNVGVNTHDIIELHVLPATKSENAFYSSEIRSPYILDIPFRAEGRGRDIIWMYDSLVKYREKGVALTPDETSEYLAYKLILDKDGMSERESNEVFDNYGFINNDNVEWIYLIWKKEAGILTEIEKHKLDILKDTRIKERRDKLNELLKGVGGLESISHKFPDKAELIVNKTLHFRQHRYNLVGHHLLYLDLDGFLHIYLRHVEELRMPGFYTNRTRFQLAENDVEIVLSHVMEDLNDEYQSFRDKYPDRDYRKYEDQAYYYNGDYYTLRVKPDGRITQFYKYGDCRY